MEEKKRKTAGQISQELLNQSPVDINAQDQAEQSNKSYLYELYGTLLSFKESNPNTDFFIEVQTISSRVLHNMIKKMFFGRLSCPTPNYDQTVWHYKHKDEELFLVWTIPDRKHCFELLENANIIDPELRELTENVKAFALGELYMLAKKLNNEDKLESLVVLKENKDDGREIASGPIVTSASGLQSAIGESKRRSPRRDVARS